MLKSNEAITFRHAEGRHRYEAVAAFNELERRIVLSSSTLDAERRRDSSLRAVVTARHRREVILRDETALDTQQDS